jgi:hypothetical protein
MDETATSGITPPATGEAKAPATDGPPQWFVDSQAQNDKRFEGLAAKMSQFQPSAAPPKDASDKAPASAITQADVDASMRLGELRAGLSEAQRTVVDELRSGGLSVAQAALVAEKMAGLGASSDGIQSANDTPSGKAANAAHSTALRFPKSFSEAQVLKRSDPAAYKQMTDHPDWQDHRLSRM